MTDTVSVIVPCYKVEPYLHRCVDSILNQTYPNLDVILVDDGSPDRCGEICDEYAAADSRVRVIHQTNQGLSAARNAGLDLMSGHYALFVDSDDWLDDTCVDTLRQLLMATGADIAVSNMLRVWDDHGPVPTSDAGEIIRMDRAQAIDEVVKPRYGSMVAACGKLFPAALLAGVRFPVGRLHEDEFTTYRLLLRAREVVVTTRPLYFYRQRSNSIMGSPFNPKAAMDAVDARIERAHVLRQEGLQRAAATTSGQALSSYMQLLQSAPRSNAPALRRSRLRALAVRLVREPQPLKFKAFYVMSFITPRTARRIYPRLTQERNPTRPLP